MTKVRVYTDEQVAEIKRRYALFQQHRPKQIAKDLGIDTHVIRAIAGRNYRRAA